MYKIIKLRLLCSVALLVTSVATIAQQQAQFTQDMVNPYMINPALSGVEDFIDIKAGIRQQWTGIEGAPVTRYLTGHSSIGKTHHARTKRNDYHNWHGIGGMFLNDQAGSISTNTLVANYAYNLKITDGKGYGMHHHDGVRLALGTFIGMTQFGFKDDLNVKVEENETALRSIALKKSWVPDASVGGMLYYLDKYYVGLSVMNVFGNSISKNEKIEDFSRFVRHYYFISAYKQKVGTELYLMPSVVARFASPLPVSYDLSLRLDYKDIFFGGVTYRNQDAIALLAGLIYNDTFEFAYSYDVTISDLGAYSSGSHELILGVRLHHKITAR